MNGVFTLEGRAHPLHFTINHLCLMEEALDMPLQKLLSSGITGMRALLWCGLMEEKITLEEAGDMVQRYLQQGGTLHALSEILADALTDAHFFRPPQEEAS